VTSSLMFEYGHHSRHVSTPELVRQMFLVTIITLCDFELGERCALMDAYLLVLF